MSEQRLTPVATRNKYYNKRVLTSEIPLLSGNRDVVLQWLYDTNLVDWYSTYLLNKPLDASYVKDIVQDVWVSLSEIQQDKWDELFRQGQPSVSAYVTGVIHQLIWSKTSKISKIYYKYRDTFKTQDEVFWKNKQGDIEIESE